MIGFDYIKKARAARRAGYKMRELTFGQTDHMNPNIVWDGNIYEAATGREICPFALQPCECEISAEGTTITFFEKNSNTPYGQAIAYLGEKT